MNGQQQQETRQHPIAELCHPLVWTLLNAVALAASLFLAWQLILALDDFDERPGAASFYLFWNFGTTFLWVVEVSFRVHDWRSKPHHLPTTLHKLALVMEWSFAILFTIDSLKLLIKWKVRKQDIEANLVEVLLNTVAFAYITVITLQESFQKGQATVRRQSYDILADADDPESNQVL
jgi:hypothetical protein